MQVNILKKVILQNSNRFGKARVHHLRVDGALFGSGGDSLEHPFVQEDDPDVGKNLGETHPGNSVRPSENNAQHFLTQDKLLEKFASLLGPEEWLVDGKNVVKISTEEAGCCTGKLRVEVQQARGGHQLRLAQITEKHGRRFIPLVDFVNSAAVPWFVFWVPHHVTATLHDTPGVLKRQIKFISYININFDIKETILEI